MVIFGEDGRSRNQRMGLSPAQGVSVHTCTGQYAARDAGSPLLNSSFLCAPSSSLILSATNSSHSSLPETHRNTIRLCLDSPLGESRKQPPDKMLQQMKGSPHSWSPTIDHSPAQPVICYPVSNNHTSIYFHQFSSCLWQVHSIKSAYIWIPFLEILMKSKVRPRHLHFEKVCISDSVMQFPSCPRRKRSHCH